MALDEPDRIGGGVQGSDVAVLQIEAAEPVQEWVRRTEGDRGSGLLDGLLLAFGVDDRAVVLVQEPLIAPLLDCVQGRVEMGQARLHGNTRMSSECADTVPGIPPVEFDG